MTNTIKKPIADCDVTELRDFATIVMGLELAPTSNTPTTLSRIRAAGYQLDYIEIQGDAGPAVQNQPSAAAPATERGEKMVDGRRFMRISIPENDKAGGDEPVFVSVNGKAMFIPRNKTEWVPEEYVEALKNAQEFVYETADDGLGLKPPRVIQSYPFQAA